MAVNYELHHGNHIIDKHQEHNVKRWDCVDVICSSGYYPADDWEVEGETALEEQRKWYEKAFCTIEKRPWVSQRRGFEICRE